MKRIAVIDKEKCNPVGCGGYLCVRVSPGNRMGNEVFVKGEDGKAHVNEEVCTDAESLTAKKCPFGAIHMIKLPEKLTTRPIHRYGKDGFILYSLPTPVFGQVTGVIGVNGVGKSTAIKVLAGALKPNLGTQDEKSLSELAELFKGSEAQNYFEKMAKGEIIVSFKPQQIDLIPKSMKGSVRALLEKVDEKEKLAEIAATLGISHILDNDITQLSGGELQRVAIAATVLKKANVYIFDEPSSYLDIKQRIAISQFIRELANEDTAVLVIEHDLIILDHMTDAMHIMYGQSGAYGIVSSPYTSRIAINTYLEGYVKADNMRFRDHVIKFEPKAPKKREEALPLVSWKGIAKTQGNFSLSAEDGSIEKGHVVGVLGENGIGKTTFVRILAKDLEAQGAIDGDVRVAYKPQYLASDSDQLVMDFLSEAREKHANMLTQLELEHLMLRKLNELSGGELQRVSIAKCITSDVQLYLMDEPSAYLDIEQRMRISKMMREFMEMRGKTALVVDHDLLFIDYLSDDLIVFDGEPGRSGAVKGPFTMEQGMNHFLADLSITLRRDKESRRPRINKEQSRLDRLQRSEGRLYYTE